MTNGVVLSDKHSKIVLHAPSRRYEESGFDHQVDVTAGPFSGSLTVHAYANAFGEFRRELDVLYKKLSGEAKLGCDEDLELRLAGDGLGHLRAEVSVVADHVRNIKLMFEVELDQTQLPGLAKSIERTFG